MDGEQLGLGDDHRGVGGDQGVDDEQAQLGRAVDEHQVVAGVPLQRLPQPGLPTDPDADQLIAHPGQGRLDRRHDVQAFPQAGDDDVGQVLPRPR